MPNINLDGSSHTYSHHLVNGYGIRRVNSLNLYIPIVLPEKHTIDSTLTKRKQTDPFLKSLQPVLRTNKQAS